MGTSLRVGNLPFQTQHDDLKILFGKYGDIGDIFLPTDRNTGRPRGFAFVRYYDKRDAEEALDALNGRTYDGRDMKINIDEGKPGGHRRFSRDDYRDRRRSRSRSGDRRRRRSSSRDRRDRSRSRDRRDRSRDRSGSRDGGRRKDRGGSRNRSGSGDRKRSEPSRSRSRS